jgi:uroporphyrinogen decarboxylase
VDSIETGHENKAVMNSKQLVSATLVGEPVPRTPVGPLAVHYCSRLLGCTIRQYSTNPELLAQSVIRYYERFRPDAVWVSADTWVSAEAMGARVGSEDENQPLGGVGEPLIRNATDLDNIPLPDPGSQGRYPLMLEALSRVVQAIGKETWVIACFDQYPFSLAASLMGLDNIMLKLADDPPLVAALMDRCADYTVAYGKALAGAGADMLSGGDSPAGLVSPRCYENFLLPCEQSVITQLRSTGKPVSLHICGRATPLLPFMKCSGADVLELDHFVDFRKACEIAGPGIALWGNVDPVAVLAQGTPELVSATARQLLADVSAAGHSRFVLSSGCTLAMETPPSNLEALIRAPSDLCAEKPVQKALP